MPEEIQRIRDSVPFPINGTEAIDEIPGLGHFMYQWSLSHESVVPPYWSRARDMWLRKFVRDSGPLKTAVGTFVNKCVTIPFSINPRDRSINRHVAKAKAIENDLRRNSGSMSSGPLKGFKEALKMGLADFLQADNGAFFLVMGGGPADGPIVGAPVGILHMDSLQITRTRDAEFPVKFLERGGKTYKIHYTRLIEMVNLPSPDNELIGVGLCAVSCCIEAAQELWDIYRYSSEKFGSRPPRQMLYAETGATVKELDGAIRAWQIKLDQRGQTHFGGTLVMAPARANQNLKLNKIDLNDAPSGFDRRDVTTIDKSEIAAAFGLDLRDLSYILGAPSRTGDAEVQDRKGRGKGVGEFLETFKERFEEVYLNGDLFSIDFDNPDDEQDEQQSLIRDKRSTARERDLRSGLTTIRIERELMWQRGEVSREQFEDAELLDGRLPNGLDVLLLFQSQDTLFKEWLNLGIADPTNIAANATADMPQIIHDKIVEVSAEVHVENKPERLRQARQALAALEKLRSMYTEQQATMLNEQASLEAADAGAEAATPGVDEPAVVKQLDPQVALDLEGGDEIAATMRVYRDQFMQLAEKANSGEIARDRFQEALAALVAAAILAFFRRGSRTRYTDLRPEELEAIQAQTERHLLSISGLTDDLYTGRYVGNVEGIAGRLDMWMNMAVGIYSLGQTYRRDEPYYAWRYGPTEHCVDCLRLNGQVHTASAWRASGWVPRSYGLTCKGLYCQCSYVESIGPEIGNF